eukprot:TRINITY_DN8494_c0_g1_i1.p2 TRINITY_DN8494_c0_g1~~TRINITY_DN8494_c0_g1_i1.p2  ORF type:complete len:844 (-),score=104.02 TRINITY_DN8494_c0_g1_i1:2532-5063(-)
MLSLLMKNMILTCSQWALINQQYLAQDNLLMATQRIQNYLLIQKCKIILSKALLVQRDSTLKIQNVQEIQLFYLNKKKTCPSKCSSCFSATECFSCQSIKYWYQNDCLDGCPLGTTLVTKTRSCNDYCVRWKDDVCLECEEGYYRAVGEIYEKYYCLTETQCKANGWYFYENQCYKYCPPGTNSVIDHTCEVCNPSCSSEINLISMPQDFSSKTKRISFPFTSPKLQYISTPIYLFTLKVTFWIRDGRTNNEQIIYKISQDELSATGREAVISQLSVSPTMDDSTIDKINLNFRADTRFQGAQVSEVISLGTEYTAIQSFNYLTKKGRLFVYSTSDHATVISQAFSLKDAIDYVSSSANLFFGYSKLGNKLSAFNGIISYASFYPNIILEASNLASSLLCNENPYSSDYFHQFYSTETSSCELCPADCKNCLSSSDCLSCQAKLYNSLSLSCHYSGTCPPGTEQHSKSCISHCKVQSVDSTCIQCEEGYLKSIGTIVDQQYCVSEASCESLGWNIFQNECYENCPAGTFSNAFHCFVCDPPCSNEFELINSKTIFDANTRIEFNSQNQWIQMLPSSLYKITIIYDFIVNNCYKEEQTEIFRWTFQEESETNGYSAQIMHHTISPLNSIGCNFFAVIDNSVKTAILSGNVQLNQEYSITETHDYKTKQGNLKLYKKSSYMIMNEINFDLSGQISPIAKNSNMKLIFGKGIMNQYSFQGEIAKARLFWNISTSDIETLNCATGTYSFDCSGTCPESCKNCLDATTCLSCNTGYNMFTYENKCLQNCDGYVDNSYQNSCNVLCDNLLDNICYQCPDNYLIIIGKNLNSNVLCNNYLLQSNFRMEYL